LEKPRYYRRCRQSDWYAQKEGTVWLKT
jgi:hypothetical protein